MKVIARRSRYLGIVFILALVLFLVYPWFQAKSAEPRVIFVFYTLMTPMLLIFLAFTVLYYKTPKDIVLYDGGYILYLPRGAKIDAKDIVNVSARTSNRYTTRKGGVLTIETLNKTYRLMFVGNCQEAVKEINNIVYKRKSELGYTSMY